MLVKQLSIFLENRSGRLEEITGILEQNGINIRALSLADTSDFGILRLIVDDPDKAENVLKENLIAVSINNVVAVVVPDKPGGLHSILVPLRDAGINIEYMYAFLAKHKDDAVIIFRFENPDSAVEVLQKAGVVLISSDELLKM